jgi:hypothetical protein
MELLEKIFPRDHYSEKARKKNAQRIVYYQDYRLEIDYYFQGKGYWDYSRGRVYDSRDGNLIADIKRNYGSFLNLFLTHPNGNRYLLCGKDYQGYTCVNLTERQIHDFLPPEAKDGLGWCWVEPSYDPLDPLKLVVEGCYWAAPYERITYDFSNPDVLPYKELNREDVKYEPEEDDGEKDGEEEDDEGTATEENPK